MNKLIPWIRKSHPKAWMFYDVYIHKTHRVEIRNMAIGVSERASSPLTAWKYRCVVCGDIFVNLTESGIRQLDEGHRYSDVVKFIGERDTKEK